MLCSFYRALGHGEHDMAVNALNGACVCVLRINCACTHKTEGAINRNRADRFVLDSMECKRMFGEYLVVRA